MDLLWQNFYCGIYVCTPLRLFNANEKKEGAFYTWTMNEIIGILGKETANIFSYHYGFKNKGNVLFQNDPREEFIGKNILYEKYSLKDTALKFNQKEKALEILINRCKDRLLKERNKRERPQLDDKIITAWWNLINSNRARHGGYIVHISIIMIGMGVIGTNFFEERTDQAIHLNESVVLDNYRIEYIDLIQESRSDRITNSAYMNVYKINPIINSGGKGI